MKRKIAVILAADIAGYSRLIAEDEEETLRRFETYRAVFAEFVERGGGRIFNTAGDAILAEFQSAVEAVRCAVDIQESLRARNLAYPPSRHMNFRIGITIGDVVERDGGDLLGDGVNIAARLESVAPPGGICVSRSVHEAVAPKMGLAFADAGLQTLKNIPERVHAYTLALDEAEPVSVAAEGEAEAPSAAAAVRTPAPDRQSQWVTAGLAVLGLAVAGAYAYEYMPRSVLETVGLVTAEPESLAPVAALPESEVVSPAAQPESTRPSGPDTTITASEPVPVPSPEPEATRPSGPDTTIQAAEEPSTVPPAVEPEPPRQSAAERAVEEAVAALDPKPGGARPAVQNPLASRYVLTRQWKDCHDSTNADVAAAACKSLIDTDGLSTDDQAVIRYKYGRALRDQGEPDQAIDSYNRSIDIKPTADAYHHRAVAYYDKSDYRRAIEDFDEAIRIKPSDPEALNNRAWTHYKAGDLDRALRDANRAVQLDGGKAFIWDTRAHIHEALGSRNAAIRDYRKALDLDAGTASSSEGLRRLGVADY